MEHDRYQENKLLFIMGMFCLISSLTLFAFSIFVLPALLMGWHYDVPEFIFTWRQAIRQYYLISEEMAGFWLFLCFIIPAIITGFISYWTSNKIDNQIYQADFKIEEENKPIESGVGESFEFGLKLFLLVLLVIGGVLFLQWLISTPLAV